MGKARRAAAAAAAASAIVLGAAKPAPPPFNPALSYRYGSAATELRLSNADGSQAVLLARMPLASGVGTAILHHALAPIGKRQAAFVYASAVGSQEVRIVNWTQPTQGGPLTVALDPVPLFAANGTGLEITSVDFSPDGSTISVVDWYQGTNQELRFFDAATKQQIGETVLVQISGANAHYRPVDGSLLMDGRLTGFSSYKDGVQTALYNPNTGGVFDNFNGTASDVIVQGVANGEATLFRWDGVTLGAPTLTTLAAGFYPSVACDNSSMIYQRGTRSKTLLYNFGSHLETTFSQDNGISQLTYPNTCA